MLPGSGGPRRPPWDDAGIHGLHRQREWDAVMTVEADAPGDELAYVVLDDTVVIESDGDLPDDVTGAFDGRLEPPYRVVGVRRGEALWALGARQIETAVVPGLEGDDIALAVGEEGTTFHVDGAQRFGSMPALEDLARDRGLDYFALQAERVDGDVWELRITAL
jgi:hypothetical protein